MLIGYSQLRFLALPPPCLAFARDALKAKFCVRLIKIKGGFAALAIKPKPKTGTPRLFGYVGQGE